MGFLSGAFGIGAAAYIQLALMVVFGVPLLQTIGTCMMVILPISAAGGLRSEYFRSLGLLGTHGGEPLRSG